MAVAKRITHLYSATIIAVALGKLLNLLVDRRLGRSSTTDAPSSAGSTDLRTECSRLPGCLFTSPQVSPRELEPARTVSAGWFVSAECAIAAVH
jgi:hypothetical protein